MYSDDNKGFCIGYNSKLLFTFIGGGSEVLYTDSLPIIKPFEDYYIQHHKQVFYKEKKWSFEKEYRTHKTWPKPAKLSDRNITITKECIEEIYFGINTPEEDLIEIKNLLDSYMPHVKIYNIVSEGGRLKINA